MQTDLTWSYVSDTVMGGVSRGQLVQLPDDAGLRLTGIVSLENNGGFVQMTADLAGRSARFDASAHAGMRLRVKGNNERYDLRLRTDALTRPWQSFRTEFVAPTTWQTLRIPFSSLTPHRTDAVLDTARLRRVGILAIGRAFEADVTLAEFGFY